MTTILIVDDDANCLQLIDRFIDQASYQIIKATNGFEAWNQLQDPLLTFDVAILDRLMPGMDGLSVLKKMKQHSRLKHIPVIFQSGLIDTNDVRHGMNAGAYYYLTKPYKRRIMNSVLEAAIEERARYQHLIECLNKADTEILSHNGHLEFRTFDEVHNIACTLASICPNPQQVVNGLSELLMNAVEHGNLQIDYDDKAQLIADDRLFEEIKFRLNLAQYKNKVVKVFWEKNQDVIRFTIKDEGEGFSPEKYLQLDPNRATHPHGRGIAMARMLSFNQLEFVGCGNQVVASIDLTE